MFPPIHPLDVRRTRDGKRSKNPDSHAWGAARQVLQRRHASVAPLRARMSPAQIEEEQERLKAEIAMVLELKGLNPRTEVQAERLPWTLTGEVDVLAGLFDVPETPPTSPDPDDDGLEPA